MYKHRLTCVGRWGARLSLLALLTITGAMAQKSGDWQDPLQQANDSLKEATGKKFNFTFDERTRWEEKTGVNFGKSVDREDMLSRIRIGAQFTPVEWFTISAMGQDTRAPFYGVSGVVGPTSMRDSMDLQEGYVELFARRKTGIGASFGRAMLNYGEARIIGTPQWGNASRSYDHARVYYHTKKMRLEALMLSMVKLRADEFNRPNLGDRLWGTYNTFTEIGHGMNIDLYALRHSQNLIGGWTGKGTLGINSFGTHFFGKLPRGFSYSFEGVGQTGHMGPATQRAYAWLAGITSKTHIGKLPFSVNAEYKYASGTKAGSSNNGTYDQLYIASHDRFGHQDLIGWRNIKNTRTLATLNLTKRLALNGEYSASWLASATDALYNGGGTVISVSKAGTAGTYVGQEADGFVTYKWGQHTFGAGFGHFFKGEFITNTTPHVNSRYMYIFQQYTIK